MKAQELRIGNLVFDRGGKIICVDYFERDKVCMKMGEYDTGLEFMPKSELHPLTEEITYCNPIPLTEEWFVKFGFEKHQWKNELWFSIQDLAIEKTDGGFFDRETSTKIDSVHWLQNYTFFKTLQELELK